MKDFKYWQKFAWDYFISHMTARHLIHKSYPCIYLQKVLWTISWVYQKLEDKSGHKKVGHADEIKHNGTITFLKKRSNIWAKSLVVHFKCFTVHFTILQCIYKTEI